jgi:malate dehydrogenase
MFGPTQRLHLVALDLAVADKPLAALAMELQDCNFPLVDRVTITTDPAVAFTGADALVFCGAFPRKDGMERKDLLLKNAEIFKAQGAQLRQYAPKHARVLVVGNPANTNAVLLSHGAYDAATGSGLHPSQITALTRLDQNRACAEAKRFLGLAGDDYVQNVTIWGNHSSTQVPDIFTGAIVKANDPDSKLTRVIDRCATDEQKAFFTMGYMAFVQQRGAAVIKARGASSAASAARAICDHMRDWIVGTAPGVQVSMGVNTTGEDYGIPAGLCFSMPCVCRNGDWQVVKGIKWEEAIAARVAVTLKELQEEKELATSA